MPIKGQEMGVLAEPSAGLRGLWAKHGWSYASALGPTRLHPVTPNIANLRGQASCPAAGQLPEGFHSLWCQDSPSPGVLTL